MNFWKPMQAMSQVWRGSQDPERNNYPVPQAMGWWWGLWLIANFASTASFRLALSSGSMGAEITNLESYKLSLWLDLLSAVTTVA